MFDNERDVACALRLAQDDQEAFEELYTAYAAPLKSYFFRQCYSDAEAEDLVQETFTRLWRARHRYRPTGRFSTYLFQIAKNLWINRRERIRGNPARQSLDGLPAGVAAEASDEQGPADKLEQTELVEILRAAIDTLPPRHRDVYIMGQIHGMRYQDIADQLGIPVGTVKSRMANAERKLREKLKRYIP